MCNYANTKLRILKTEPVCHTGGGGSFKKVDREFWLFDSAGKEQNNITGESQRIKYSSQINVVK